MSDAVPSAQFGACDNPNRDELLLAEGGIEVAKPSASTPASPENNSNVVLPLYRSLGGVNVEDGGGLIKPASGGAARAPTGHGLGGAPYAQIDWVRIPSSGEH